MGSKEAYDAIRRAIGAKPGMRVLSGTYDGAAFGNFLIAFEADRQPKSVVNERGQLALCDDVAGTQHCGTIVPSLAAVDERKVIEALAL